MATDPEIDRRLSQVEGQLTQISAQLQQLIDQRKGLSEFTEEMGPIASKVMGSSIEQFAHWEERGYFAFARECGYLLERIVEDYRPSDLHALADNVANILDTVKALTQPATLAAVRDAAEAFDEARDPEPLGAFGAWRKLNNEKDVRRGLGFALDVLGRVGRSVARAPRLSRSESSPKSLPASAPAARPSESERPAVQPLPASFRFVPDGTWNHDYAKTTANDRGVGELTEAHFRLIDFAREDYSKNGCAPNIRRITTQAGVSTREVYDLFPKAPGLTIACLAGVPKPAGCL